MAGKSRIAEAYMQVVPVFEGVNKQVASQFGSLNNTASKAGDAMGNNMKRGMLSRLKGLAGPLIGAIGVATVVNGIKKQFEALARIEVINTQTETVIKSMGNAANISAKQVNELAASLERTTATEAESVQEGMNMLLTFGNIKNAAGEGNDIFNQTTKIMVDLSRAMGQDTKTSAIQLGKALNDPVKGVGALSRVGVSFTAQEKEKIKALQESGDLMGAQKVILAALQSQFGGQGEAYAQTFAGTLDLIKHELGNIGETILGTAMPGLQNFAKMGLGALQGFVDNLPSIMSGIGETLGPIFNTLKEAFGPVIPLVIQLFQALSPMSIIFKALQPVLMQIATTFGQVLGGVLKTLVPVITEVVNILSGSLMVVFEQLAPIIQLIVSRLGGILIQAIMKLAPVLVQLAQFFGNLIVMLMPLIEAILLLVEPLLNALWPVLEIIITLIQLLLPPIMAVIQIVVASLIPVIMLVVNAFKNWIQFVGGIYSAFSKAFNGLPQFFKSVFNPILSFFEGFVNFFIDGINIIIKALRKLKVEIPDWVPFIGGQTWGINIPLIPRVNIPRLAEGGLVMPQPNGIIANIAEARQPEVVYPLDRFEKMMGLNTQSPNNLNENITVNINAPVGQTSEEQITKAIERARTYAGW